MVRAVGWSLVVCTATVLVMAALIQAAQVGGTLTAIAVMAVYFSLTYLAVAVLVLLPVFVGLERLTTVLTRRRTAALIGAVLAALTSLLFVVVVFGRAGDPASPGAWLMFWISNAGPFAAGLAPFLAGGATFGWQWTAPLAPPEPPEPSGRRHGRRRPVTPSRSTSSRAS